MYCLQVLSLSSYSLSISFFRFILYSLSSLPHSLRLHVSSGLHYIGFGSSGVIAKSLAAGLQSPWTVAGSYFAICQSIGALAYVSWKISISAGIVAALAAAKRDNLRAALAQANNVLAEGITAVTAVNREQLCAAAIRWANQEKLKTCLATINSQNHFGNKLPLRS
jgi:hypothetical protein